MIGGSMDVSEHLRLNTAPCGHGSLELFGFHSYVRLSEIHRWHDASRLRPDGPIDNRSSGCQWLLKKSTSMWRVGRTPGPQPIPGSACSVSQS
jgi:hypothetical protein